MPATFSKPSIVLTSIVFLFMLYGCGGGSSDSNSSTGNQITGEESNTETTDRNDVAVQGTVWRFSTFNNADGSANVADDSYANNFIYLAPFTESFRGIYGCAAVTGSYVLNGNDLSITEQENESVECSTTGPDYEANLLLTQRVLAGPSTISVSNDVLTLVSGTNESITLVAAQEE